MFSRAFKISLLAAFLATCAAAVVLLRLDNARLRQRIAEQRHRDVSVTRLRADSLQAQRVLVAMGESEAEGERAIRDELGRLRHEVSELEKQAQEKRARMLAQNAADARSLEANSDPKKGLARLENFQPAGRLTPSAAFQTFVWAVMKGDDKALEDVIAFDAASREKAAAIVSALAEGDRAKYSTPEKLAALFFADMFTTMPAAEITGVATTGSKATLRLRGLTPKEQELSLQLGFGGWQIVITEEIFEKLEAWSHHGTRRPSKS